MLIAMETELGQYLVLNERSSRTVFFFSPKQGLHNKRKTQGLFAPMIFNAALLNAQ